MRVYQGDPRRLVKVPFAHGGFSRHAPAVPSTSGMVRGRRILSGDGGLRLLTDEIQVSRTYSRSAILPDSGDLAQAGRSSYQYYELLDRRELFCRNFFERRFVRYAHVWAAHTVRIRVANSDITIE
jgi:hypothetical protein